MGTGSSSTVAGSAPALFVSAPASGSGKSVITAALARLHRNAGRDVRVFKHGPDFLDPMLLERASGATAYQIHPWMTGEDECRWRLARAAAEADLVLVEGSMGLFDGDASSADLAVLAGMPVLPVIDAAGMAQTFGAVVLGLKRWRDDLRMDWVVANRVGSPGHTGMLRDALPDGIGLLGGVPRTDAMSIPDRHLGIFQADEIEDLDERLDRAAAVLADVGCDQLPEAVRMEAAAPEPVAAHLAGRRVAVARDAAFAFIYPANLEWLREAGAEVVFFSPLADEAPPADADAVWLPGGYPELHLDALRGLRKCPEALRAHHAAGRALLAECGGLMFCMEAVVDRHGREAPGLGLLPGRAVLKERLCGLGLQSYEDGEISTKELRGHTFHHSTLETRAEPAGWTTRLRGGTAAEAVYRDGGLTGTYFHAYFPSAPALAAHLLGGDTEGAT